MANGFDLQTVGRALSGLSAGIQGRGVEFAQGLRDEEQAKVEKAKAGELTRRREKLIDNRVALDHLVNNRPEEFFKFGASRIDGIEKFGGDPSDTLSIITLVRQGETEKAMERMRAFDREGVINGELDEMPSLHPQGASPVQSSQFIPGIGFATISTAGDASLVPLEGAGETAAQRRAAERAKTEGTEQTKSDIDVAGTEKKEVIKRKVARVSEMRKEFGERKRKAGRSGRVIREALTLVAKTSQGIEGAVKLKLSKLLPGIDSGNEGALDSVLKQLALEQLQNFSGPTTDFEFGVTESIVGELGNSKESNRARLKSLERASWFQNREVEQFERHMKKGGDPDSFAFNFGVPVDTKKGVFTLKDLQDTAVKNNISIDDVLKRLNK
tara:strand:+ start:315 stop:1469 length:1155 start_codon:yes stop_codon:yes gene_type:complete